MATENSWAIVKILGGWKKYGHPATGHIKTGAIQMSLIKTKELCQYADIYRNREELWRVRACQGQCYP
jgi:hypothetical protein